MFAERMWRAGVLLLSQPTPYDWVNPFYMTGIFLHPHKTSQSRGFLMFSEGIEKDQWHGMSDFGFRLYNVEIISLKPALVENRLQM